MSIVTAPLRAKARPSIITPVVMVMDVSARMLPPKVEFVPSVAELPICQKTLQGCAPLMNETMLAEAVVRVEPAWKTQIASGSPSASSVIAPVRPIELADEYTPGVRVRPPRSPATMTSGVCPAALLYAAVRSI